MTAETAEILDLLAADDRTALVLHETGTTCPKGQVHVGYCVDERERVAS